MREATQSLHEQVEEALPWMHGPVTSQAYGTHLRRLWPLVAATEGALAPWLPHLVRLSQDERLLQRRAFLLQQDCQTLGLEAAPPGAMPPLACSSLPHAVGCWYVLGGSRLGGQVIYRRLAGHLPQAAETSLRYYAACCRADGGLFRHFLAAIDRRADLARHRDEVVEGAVTTFTHWYHGLTSLPLAG
jgi:heme oxygenase